METNAEKLRAEFGHWGTHPQYSVQEWQIETHEGNTRLGYWEWVATLLNGDAEVASVTTPIFTVADADRLLGLCDQFLEDWSEDAVQSGGRDLEYEARRSEWTEMRPLLVSAPALLGSLQAIVERGRTSQEPCASCCAAIALKAIAEIGTRHQSTVSATRGANDLTTRDATPGGGE